VINPFSPLISRPFLGAALTFALASPAFAAAAASDDSVWEKDPSAWKAEIRPIQLWVPHLSTRITLPDLPNRPNGTASTSSIDGAYSGGFRVEKNKWSLDTNFLFVDLTADNPKPKLQADTNIKLLQFMAGREVLPGLSLEGGVRGMSMELAATLLENPEVSGKVTLWDPLIGLSYRKPLGKKWRLHLHGDGGGFGAGSEVTYSGNATLDWRFARHFGLSFGYNFLHFETTNTFTRRNVTTEPTIHGPVIGFCIYF
jgi:opacity protein-like surface antigen